MATNETREGTANAWLAHGRTVLAALNLAPQAESVGRVEHIVPKSMVGAGLGADKARTLDFSDVLRAPDEEGPRRCTAKL